MASDLTIAACATSIPLLFFFAFFAMYSSYKDSKTSNLNKFLAAHNSQPLSRVVYSLISTSLGAWVIFLPASYCLIAGYIGLINYAISAGITIIIPSLFGPIIQRRARAIWEKKKPSNRLESTEKEEEIKEMMSPPPTEGRREEEGVKEEEVKRRTKEEGGNKIKEPSNQVEENHKKDNNEMSEGGIEGNKENENDGAVSQIQKEDLVKKLTKKDPNLEEEVSGVRLESANFARKKTREEEEEPVLSLSDYVRRRFGLFAQYLVSLMCLYSMMIGLIAEYTAIGDLFEFVVGAERIMIVLMIGLVTSFYTSYGGLLASIKMDQFQGIFVIILNIIFAVYMLATFRLDTDRPLTENLDANMLGYDSIAALNIGLAGSVIYSESFWQKAWIASSERDLRKGSLIAALIVIVIVFLFGFYGFLAAWNGMEASSFNLALFALFQNNEPSWMIVIIVNMAVIMNESAVDSYQIGIVSSISTCFLKNKPLYWTQILVLLINAPLIWLSLASYPIMNLFLSANLITAAGSIPLLLGLSNRLKPYYNTINFVLGLVGGLILASIWGWKEVGDFEAGLNLIFYLEYRWQSFVISVAGGMGISLITAGVIWGWKKLRGMRKVGMNN